MLPGGSPLKPPSGKAPPGSAAAAAAQAAVLNGSIHGRQASAGSDAAASSLFGPSMGDRQQLSLAAAAAWAPHSTHSSLDSGGGLAAQGGGAPPAGQEPLPAGSSGSSGSEALLPGLGRYERSTADSWFADRSKGRQLV